jgi:hypothetical protein
MLSQLMGAFVDGFGTSLMAVLVVNEMGLPAGAGICGSVLTGITIRTRPTQIVMSFFIALLKRLGG